MKLRPACAVIGFLSLVLSMAAQTSGNRPASAQVPPPLIQFSNVATDEGGNPLSGAVNITFSLYNSQQGGEPLWTETQSNVQLDPTGHYSVQLGITKPNGVPTALFTTGEARWLGVQVAEQAEQPHILLLSVPYALKAGDAATVGGLPPSAFVLAAPQNGTASAYATGSAMQSVSPATATDVTTTGGRASYLPVFNGTATIVDSAVFQSGSGSGTSVEVKGSGAFTGDTRIDINGLNKGGATGYTPAIRFGTGNTGEAISSDRTGSVNVNGIDFYTDFTPRLSITNGGNVGIGTTNPTTGILTTVANSASVVGISTTGYNAPFNSNVSGYDGMHVTGGSGDDNNSTGGGIGLVATGGSSLSGFPGAGLVANGGTQISGGYGAAGMIGNGSPGGGDDDAPGAGGAGGVFTGGGNAAADFGVADGGDGIDGTGGNGTGTGAGTSDGVGGSFTGGNAEVNGDGINAQAGSGLAGNFLGDVEISGTLNGSAPAVKIDHPLDPANKYLLHASVESSEMMNIYTGNVTTDGRGYATVQLPGWFELLNTDFRYQLTVIGQFAQAIVAHEIESNRFEIRTNAPNVKVSWQVAGVRQDAYAKSHPL